jgi:hypothetical protein
MGCISAEGGGLYRGGGGGAELLGGGVTCSIGEDFACDVVAASMSFNYCALSLFCPLIICPLIILSFN